MSFKDAFDHQIGQEFDYALARAYAQEREDKLIEGIKQTICWIESTNAVRPEDGGQTLSMMKQLVEQ